MSHHVRVSHLLMSCCTFTQVMNHSTLNKSAPQTYVVAAAPVAVIICAVYVVVSK